MEENERLQVAKPEPKVFGTCTDEAVLKGYKFCFCCVPSCPYYKLVTKEELQWKNKKNALILTALCADGEYASVTNNFGLN